MNPPSRTIAVVRITLLNHKTRHSSPPTMQTGRITPLEPIQSGFVQHGAHVAIQSAFFNKKFWDPSAILFSSSSLSFLSLSLLSLALFSLAARAARTARMA